MNVFDKQADDSTIFQVGIDETAKAYLLETTRWARFLAITGFIIMGFWLLGLIAVFANISDITNQLGAVYGIGYGSGMLIAFVIGGGLFFYINFAMYKFATNTRRGVNTFNQLHVSEGFRHLKNMFKIWGIMTILVLALYGLIIVFAIIGVALAS